MRIAVFSTKPYDRAHLAQANAQLDTPHELTFLEARLTAEDPEREFAPAPGLF